MLEWLVLTFWVALVAYVFWYVFKAKTENPIGLNELALTWKIHKQNSGCKAKRIQSLITINNETVGLKCECGYEFIQKRLISQKAPENPVKRSIQ